MVEGDISEGQSIKQNFFARCPGHLLDSSMRFLALETGRRPQLAGESTLQIDEHCLAGWLGKRGSLTSFFGRTQSRAHDTCSSCVDLDFHLVA